MLPQHRNGWEVERAARPSTGGQRLFVNKEWAFIFYHTVAFDKGATYRENDIGDGESTVHDKESIKETDK